MARTTGLLLILIISLSFVSFEVTGQKSNTRISARCRGAKPTRLTLEERKKAQETARWASSRDWKIAGVSVHKCEKNNLREVRVGATAWDNDHYESGTFLFFESHKNFQKALTLHEGMDMKVEYTSVDQDPLWSEGEDLSFVKFLRISKVQ